MPAGRRLQHVDAVNTFRYVGISRVIVTRRFVYSNPVFLQFYSSGFDSRRLHRKHPVQLTSCAAGGKAHLSANTFMLAGDDSPQTSLRGPKGFSSYCVRPEEQARQDNGVNLYEDEAMRMLVVFASFAAVIGVATPAQADRGSNDSGPDASFLAAVDKAGITYERSCRHCSRQKGVRTDGPG